MNSSTQETGRGIWIHPQYTSDRKLVKIPIFLSPSSAPTKVQPRQEPQDPLECPLYLRAHTPGHGRTQGSEQTVN